MPPPLPPRRQTSKNLKSSQKIPSSNNSAPAVNRTVVKDNEDRLRKSSSLSTFNRSSSQYYPETSSALKTVAPISQDSNQNNRTTKSSVENNPIQQLFSAFSRRPKQASEPNITGNKQKRPSSDKSKNLLRAKKTASDEDLRYRKSKPSSEGNRQIRGPPTNYEKRRSANDANVLKPTYRRSYSDDPRNILVVSKFNVANQRSADPYVKNSAPSNPPCSDLSPVPECVRANNYMVKSVPDEVRSVRASKPTPTLGNARSNALKVAPSATSRGVRVSKSSPEVTRSTRVTKPTVGYTKTAVKNPTKAKNNVIRGLFGSENLHNNTLKNNTAVVVALNHNNNIVLTPVSSKRATYPDSSNVTLRRGQAQGASASKASNGNALRGASSVTSLDSKHKVAPLNSGKLVKANSKEKIDKPIAPPIPPQKNERSKNESKNNKTNNIAAALKNNNRIDLKEPIITNGDTKGREVIGPVSLPGTLEASDAELAMQELASVQQELELVTREKATLALELSTYQGELQSLRTELTRLQSYQDQHSSEMDHLVEENAVLRSRLMEVAHSPLSDNEKQQLLLDTQRQHNSAPASFSTNEMGDISTPHLNGAHPSGEMTSSCPTPDWDKHSSSSMSEVSVACLQDRILQMEETHYSTNEELQATLQELADLQTQLLELQVDNERLRDEKTVLLESLCQQTEKLEDSRAAVGTLRELLIRSGGGGSQPEDAALDDAQIREQKLVDLLKAAQEEREALLSKHEELMNELHTLRQSATVQVEEREQLVDRVRLLETTVDSVHAERKLIDEELAKAKEQSSARRIEISQLSTLLDNARSKIDELEKERDKGDRSEMDALLDSARKEKDTLESQVAELQGEVSRGQCEKERLKEQLSTLQEECKVAKNNAKTVISDIEYQLSEAKREISNLKAELQTSHNALLEVQAQVQRHLEDKRGLKAVLAETQRSLADMERRLTETEEKLRDEEDRREKENEEWEQFRRDLLMTVRVANDFKTEAQSEREKLVLENKMLKDRARALETQLEKLKAVKTPSPTLIRQSSVPVETQNSLLTSVQQEMAARRQKVGSVRQENPLSVKSLIESIENATKQVKAGPGGSHNSSTSSLNSIASDIRTPSTAPSNGGSLSVPVSAGNGDWTERTAKSPLREQQQSVAPTVNKTQRSPSNKNLITDVGYGNKTDGKPEDSIRESVAILSAKSIDFVRRNSYGDLSERKDPLNGLVKNGGSKRNALLKWCQQKTVGYRNIDITNFSSSWNDGLALCALLHTYLPDRIPYDTLVPTEKRRNFSLAFAAAESVGIPTTLNINDMCQLERPDWQQVMGYVTAIYKHFET